MQNLGLRSFEQYLMALDKDEELRARCESLMTVSVSRFFRDRFLWEAMENKIVPDIIEKNRDKVRVWFAGCGCGEEVFSFTILWDQLKGRFRPLPTLLVLASDMNKLYLKRAQRGVFSRSSLKEISNETRTKYFTRLKEGERYQIIPLLQTGISWKRHNLLHDPPDHIFHLIFLRNNLLTYYADTIKIPAFQNVVSCLITGGYLVVGSHERLPIQDSNLLPFEKFPYVFKTLYRPNVIIQAGRENINNEQKYTDNGSSSVR